MADREAKDRARQSRGEEAPSDPGALPSEAASRGGGGSRDREAKDRAKRSRSDGASKPGASASVTSSPRSSRDREAKDRARRGGSDGPAKPGAQSSTASVDRSTRKQQRHSGSSDKPGASSSTASEDRATRKQQRNSKTKEGVGVAVGLPTSKDSASGKSSKSTEPPPKTAPLDPSDGYQVEAVAVNEDEDDERVRKLERQMQAMMASQTAAVPTAQVATAANAGFVDDSEDEEVVGEEDEPCFQKYKWVFVVLVVLAIGGGVAGYFLSQGGSEPAAAPVENTNPTPAPITTSPSSGPTTFLIHDPPSDAECFAIANNVPLNDQESMDTTSVSISFDVSLTADQDTSTWLTPFEEGLQSSFVPALVGCPAERRLREQLQNNDRKLEDNPSRYAIANADSSVSYLPNESCDSDAAQPCKRVEATMDLFVKDDYVSYFDVVTIIYDVVGDSEDGNTAVVDVFGLSTSQFQGISVAGITNLSPTLAPSPSPTKVPTTTTPPPTIRQTPSPTPKPVSRRGFLQSLLSDHAPLNSQALNWLADTDTWEPAPNVFNAEAQWLERYALAVFYFSTNGNAWTDKTEWLSSNTVCGWFGINNCQSNLVRELFTSSNNLVGTIPTEIGLLTTLTKLAPFENAIAGTIPTEIGLLTALTALELDVTQVTGSIPTELGKLTMLEEFFVFDTFVTGTIPTEIVRWTNLHTFEVHKTQLQGNIPEELWGLTWMEELKVFETNLDGTISTKLGQLSYLRVLEFDVCQFSGNIPSEIGELSFLTFLTAFSNNFNGSIPTEIGRLTALTRLELDNNFLTGTIPSEIIFLSSLQGLTLHDNDLSGDVPPLPALPEQCDLNANCFDDASNAFARNCQVDNSNC